MKSIPKLIRRFLAILLLSFILIVIINCFIFALIVGHYSSYKTNSPYTMATATGKALHASAPENFELPQNVSEQLKESGAWGILIDENTREVIWKTDNVPSSIPSSYTLADIADLSVGYLDGYPTYTGKNEKGIVVLGFPKDSFWKHMRPTWNYALITHAPQIVLITLCVNVACILLIYVIANATLLKSVKPLTKGIQDLSRGKRVYIPQTGVLSEISVSINRTSDILQKQQEQLKKKETAQANWIAGVSHDIRTPLSMVMGYASQLESSSQLLEAEHKKAAAIVKQSRRIKDLISDLNLTSKLEYNMQPLMKKQENAVALVRHVVVDYMNMDIDAKFPIVWKADDKASRYAIEADKNLLKRAISNLIQNSINHNENGCTIYISVFVEKESCVIGVEDSGVGVSDEQLEKLNKVPHYMACDVSTNEQRHGLGLFIVKAIVEAHQGTLVLDHSQYGGFKATLMLPLAQKDI